MKILANLAKLGSGPKQSPTVRDKTSIIGVSRPKSQLDFVALGSDPINKVPVGLCFGLIIEVAVILCSGLITKAIN